MNNIKKFKISKSDYLFDFAVYSILIFAFIVVIYPLYFMVISSFSDPNLVNAGEIFLYPKGINFSGYSIIFKDSRIWEGYRNTIIYTVGDTFFQVSISLMTGYSLSKKYLFGRSFISLFFVITMFFGGGLIPLYITVKQLGLINKPVIMWILGALSVFHVILARTYFQTTIPGELEDAAYIDGCSQARYFTRIVLPLSKPLIAVLAIYAAVGQWNSFFGALIFLNDRKYYPLQLVLRDILISNQEAIQDILSIEDMKSLDERATRAELIKYGLIIVSSAPLLMMYPFFQRYFVKGVMIGSLKG